MTKRTSTKTKLRPASDEDEDAQSLHSDAPDEQPRKTTAAFGKRQRGPPSSTRTPRSTKQGASAYMTKRTSTKTKLHPVSDEDEDAQSWHSDALDEQPRKTTAILRKRQRGPPSSTRTDSNTKSKQEVSEKKTPARKKRKVAEDDTEESEDDAVDVDVQAGQEVVGKVVEAPATGWAPDGQISQHTLDFLKRMRDPACNDRVWFKLHEPIYRRCETEFKNFIEAFTAILTAVDPQIPPLPPKDVIHRIYRDIRFSNNKTPYKNEFSASFSRSGRKGQFAFYHVAIKSGNESVIAAGAWCPAKNELNMIRNHIKHSSDRLREVISEPEFVALFGEARPHPQGKRQNVFGAEDELKTAPKGVDRNHKDIDLLKCRSLAVLTRFTDEQVLMGSFIQELEKVAGILRPFVHCLNDMITTPVEDDSGEDEAE